MAETLAEAVSRRRTFAIIAHPDAGKTTLTEKLLLFGGAIQLAGEVKANRRARVTRGELMMLKFCLSLLRREFGLTPANGRD